LYLRGGNGLCSSKGKNKGTAFREEEEAFLKNSGDNSTFWPRLNLTIDARTGRSYLGVPCAEKKRVKKKERYNNIKILRKERREIMLLASPSH